jgi:dienelactone hydrolase
MLTGIAAFALLVASPYDDLLAWLDRIAQAQLDARQKRIEAIHTREAGAERNREVRAKMLQLLGGLPDYNGPLNARTTGRIAASGYTIEKVLFESLPRYYVTGNLYVPATPGKHPGILFSLGHWEQGKPAAQQIAGNLALKGFVVFAYDPVGQGERVQAYDWRLGRSLGGGATEQHTQHGALSLLVGQELARYNIWDAKRALDYLTGRPEVDAARIGSTGCSGGGTITTYISALDDRIKVAVPSCYMNSFRLLFPGPLGDSEQSWGGFLASGLDQADFVELFAPKPWLMTSTREDFFTPAGARIVYEEARQWYRRFDAEDRIQWVVGPGGHGTPREVREAIYAWFLRWLGPAAPSATAVEQDIEFRPDHEFRVGETGQVSVDFHGRELYEVIKDAAVPPVGKIDVARAMRDLIAHKPPANVKREASGEVHFEPDEGLSLTARILALPGSGRRPAVLVVQSEAEPSQRAREIAAAGEVVLVLVPRGLPAPPTVRFTGDWITNLRASLVGRSLPAMRANDILCGVDVLAAQPDVDPAQIRAVAEGTPGAWLLMAAAADARIGRVNLYRTPFSLRAALDNPVNRGLHDAVIRGAALHWDFDDLVKAIAPREVVWTDPTDWMRNVVVRPGFSYSTFAH